MTLESLKTRRTALAAYLSKIEPFNGRYVGRLSDTDRAAIRAADNGDDIGATRIIRHRTRHKPTIDVSPIR